MSLDELHTLERERRAADREYNDALTAFDRALIRTAPRAAVALVADATPPAVPAGWRGRSLRVVSQWLAPWIERQHALNARTAEAIEALVNRDHERAIAFEQFQSALITFLQQITAFIDTKDRQLSAVAAGRLDEQHAMLVALQQRMDDTLPELRAQVAVLQRAMELLKRRMTDPQPAPASVPATGRPTGVATPPNDD